MSAEVSGVAVAPASAVVGGRVEDVRRRTRFSSTFANPDGTMTTELSSAPVHFRDGSGSWQPIDTRLVDTDRAGFVAQNVSAGFRLLVPLDAAAAPLRIEDAAGGWMSMRLLQSSGAPLVAASHAAVSDGPGAASVRYDSMSWGVKESIVLATAPSRTVSYSTDLRLSAGLVPELTEGDEVVVRDAAGFERFRIPAPVMFDSGPGAAESSSLSVALFESPGGWTLTVTPDLGWLQDGARSYPVTIDPSVVVSGSDILRDTFLAADSPTTANSTGTWLRAGSLDGTNGTQRRSLLAFVMPSVPLAATVSNAKVQLYVSSALNGAGDTYAIRRMKALNAGGVTWSNQATWNGSGTGTSGWDGASTYFAGNSGTDLFLGSGAVGAWRGWTGTGVDGIVQSWVSDPATNNLGLMIKPGVGAGVNELRFASSETSNPPKLSFDWSIGAENFGDKIGERDFFKFEEHALNDRLTAKVNVANGNLLLSSNDLSITGTGLSVGLSRYYNSLPDTSGGDLGKLTPGWSMSGGLSERLLFPAAGNDRVVFQHGSGYRVQFDRTASGYAADEPGIKADLTFDSTAGEYTLKWFTKEKWIFNSAGLLIREKDKNDNTLTFTRDSNNGGRLTKITDTRNRDVLFAYTGPGGLLSTITDTSGGRTLNYGYEQVPGTSTYRLTQTWLSTYGLGSPDKNLNAPTTYGYDSSNRLTTVTDPLGDVTQVGYDGTSRRVLTLTRPTPADSTVGDSTWTYSYLSSLDNKCQDDAGQPTGGAIRATRVNGPRADVIDDTTYCFDKHDRLVQSYDAKNHKRATKYDSNSNVVSFNESGVVGGSGPAFDYSYTDNNLTKVTMPTTGPTTAGSATAQYADSNANPHLPTSVYNFDNPKTGSAAWVYDYDDDGNLIEARAPGQVTSQFRYCYDAHGSLTRIDAPPNAVALDNNTGGIDTTCTTATTSQGNDTLLAYNSLGELTTVDEPGTRRTTTLTYDALSRVKTITDGRGVVATYIYDAQDRLIAIAYDASGTGLTGVGTVTYDYDLNGNLTQRSDATGSTNFTYDELNRTTKESPEAGVASTTTYTYDEASNLRTSTVTSEPGPVTYSYDNLNRTTKVADQKNNTTTFGYDNQDRRITTTYPNGVTMKSHFDDARRLRCIYSYTGTSPSLTDGCPGPSASLITLRKYGYTSPAGLDTSQRYDETNERNEKSTYTYDSIQRLTTASTKTNGGTGTELRGYTYTIDGRGNITKKIVTGTQVTSGTTTLAYADNNELCWTASGTSSNPCANPPTGATTYSYDGAGNTASSTAASGPGIKSATYNLQSQTASITPPGTTTPFLMEYADVTSDRRTLAGNTRMAYSLLGLTAQGPNGGTAHTELFVRDPNTTLISRVQAANNDNNALYYLVDGLGSVIATTNQNGTTIKKYDYDPYGTELNPTPADTNPWRYAAGYHDTPTGLTKFGTRYYNPTLMRWTQTDPISGRPTQPQRLNAYAYVGCSPTNRTDSQGRYWGEDFVDEVTEWDGWDETQQLIGLGAECAASGAMGGAFGAAFGSFFVPGLTTAGGAAIGFVYGCAAGMIASGATGYNPFVDQQGVF